MQYEDAMILFERAQRIFASDLDPKTKYDQIFSDEISSKFVEEGMNWYDPDTSYEEDVESFMRALTEYMAERKKVHEAVADKIDKTLSVTISISEVFDKYHGRNCYMYDGKGQYESRGYHGRFGGIYVDESGRMCASVGDHRIVIRTDSKFKFS